MVEMATQDGAERHLQRAATPLNQGVGDTCVEHAFAQALATTLQEKACHATMRVRDPASLVVTLLRR